jgi:hypothetical protein
MDGTRQDGYDLFLGNYHVNTTTTPFQVDKPLRARAVPPILGFALVMLLLHLLRPALFGPRSMVSYMTALVFWLSVLVSALKFSLRHSNYFVSLPHLSTPPRATYEGDLSSKPFVTARKVASTSLQ